MQCLEFRTLLRSLGLVRWEPDILKIRKLGVLVRGVYSVGEYLAQLGVWG